MSSANNNGRYALPRAAAGDEFADTAVIKA